MNLLLDTHVFLWWDSQDKALNAELRALIADPANQVFVSAASIWEIAIKHRLKTLDFRASTIGASGFHELPILPIDAEAAGALAWRHNDPFDRILVAQAQRLTFTLVTADAAIRSYTNVARCGRPEPTLASACRFAMPRPPWQAMQSDHVLNVEALRTEFRIGGAWHAAVDGVSFALAPRETLALVGESGCGKSVTALSVMGLVPKPQGRIAGGRILLEGRELVGLREPALEKLRGDRVAMIFQEPMTSLNPVMTIGAQVTEALIVHKDLTRREAEAKALAVLDEVKIPSAAQRFHEYPHQFSGGMRQRVMIAMALACEPAVLLADEPTTALDVTIQAQVLGLLADLKDRHGMAMLFITHNLGVVAQIADRVAVMYAGQIVEQAPVSEVFARPAHPYTRALFAAIPRMDRDAQDLAAIPGRVPPLDAMPAGCRFAPRCPLARAGCEKPQVLAPFADGHLARCHVATGALVAPEHRSC